MRAKKLALPCRQPFQGKMQARLSHQSLPEVACTLNNLHLSTDPNRPTAKQRMQALVTKLRSRQQLQQASSSLASTSTSSMDNQPVDIVISQP